MEIKNPSVLHTEQHVLPESIVQLAASVPVFIGYTKTAANNGVSLINTAVKINSLVEYNAIYGGAAPVKLTIDEVDFPGNNSNSISVNGKYYSLKPESGLFYLYYCIRLFFLNGGDSCYIISVGSYNSSPAIADFVAALQILEEEEEPALVLIPDSLLLDQASYYSLAKQMLDHCKKLQRRMAILDVYENPFNSLDSTSLADKAIADFSNSIGGIGLSYGAAYFPWLYTSIVLREEITYKNFPAMNWASYLESTDEISTLLPLITSSDVSTLTEETLVSKQVHEVHQVLLAVSPNYLQLIDIAVARLNILPPAGAMAGVYASLDGSQGVWKAPANVKLNAVKAPVIVLNDQEQEMLVNVTRGKYINSIRSFTGQGVLVWGARTIEGNDHEFKYICVRRTAIMIEQSIRKALQLYALKPNDSNTWGVVKGMIQNFLNALWRQGAFRGIKQEEAFFVTIGLGSTMTEEDILQGLMVIKIGVAFVRPAEFTYIKIVRQMQKME